MYRGYVKVLGENHVCTINASLGLAVALHSLGQHTEAEKIQRQVVAKWIRLSGDDDAHSIAASDSTFVSGPIH